MYTLFDITEKDRKHGISIPKFKHVKNIVSEQAQKVEDYYRFYNQHIPSNHPLLKLIYSLNVSLDRDIFSFVSAAQDRTDRLAKTFKMIHPTNQNVETWDGTFYNDNTVEYVIASEDDFNISLAWDKWESIVPVKIHTHPFNDMSMGIPIGKYPPHLNKGAAVISVNIAMLALQFKAWVHYEQNKGERALRLESFIYNYVLANMVKRHTEICLINRTVATILEYPVDDFVRMHPLYVIDHTSKVDEVLKSRATYIEKSRVDFNQLHLVYGTLFFKTWASVLKLPKMAPTRHSRWIFLLAYLPRIHFYLKIVQRQDSRLDREVLQQLNRHIRYLDNTRAIPTNLDAHTNVMLEEVKDLLNTLKA